MTSIMGAKSKSLAAGFAIAGVMLLGTLAVSASAEERHDQRGGERHDNRDHDRGDRGGGGYYAAPPVVYGNQGYYPPPVVYGPAVGIVLPGVSIGIR
jgi:hypothetical protein